MMRQDILYRLCARWLQGIEERRMDTYILSAAVSEALPTEYSVSPTEQPSSDALSSYSTSPDPAGPISVGDV